MTRLTPAARVGQSSAELCICTKRMKEDVGENNILKEEKFSDVRGFSNVWVGQKFYLGVFITSYGKTRVSLLASPPQ